MCWRFFPASHDESCLSGSWWFTDRCRLARWHTGILDKGHKKCEWSSTCLTLKQFDPNRDDPSGLGAFGITERGWCRGHTAVQISIMGMRLHLGYSRSSYPVNIFLRKFTSNIKIEVFETIYSVSFSLSIWCCYLPLSLSLSLCSVLRSSACNLDPSGGPCLNTMHVKSSCQFCFRFIKVEDEAATPVSPPRQPGVATPSLGTTALSNANIPTDRGNILNCYKQSTRAADLHQKDPS